MTQSGKTLPTIDCGDQPRNTDRLQTCVKNLCAQISQRANRRWLIGTVRQCGRYLLSPDSILHTVHAGRKRRGRVRRGESENASPLRFFTLIWNTGDKRASAIWEATDCERISVTTLIIAVVERVAGKASNSVTTARRADEPFHFTTSAQTILKQFSTQQTELQNVL